jgi:fucose 4-O-acetylase-like acetyltransferase
MNRFLSQKFRVYSFVCIALLTLVHGYNLRVGYLQAFSMVDEPLTFTTFFEFLMANGLLRFRIPLLFIISGYIFSLQDNKTYPVMIGKRFKTLMIPFFIWSAVGLLVTYALQQFPVTAQAVKDSLMDQLGDHRPYEQIGWRGIIYRWLVVPVSFQLWFIRSLFIYNLLYPVFKWGITKFPYVWLGIMFLIWITQFNIFFFEGNGLFFFSIGIWLQKSNYPIDKKPVWFSSYLAWVCFIGFGIIKSFMAFELEDTLFTRQILILLYAATVIAGLLAVWFSLDDVVKWCMQRKWFVWLTAFSFVIYGMHVPLIEYITMLMYKYMNHFPNYRLIVYVLAPATVICICVITGALLRQLLPKVYRVATGGRGF